MADQNEQASLQQLEAMKKQLLGKVLSREAYERIARVRLANPSLATQVEMYLLQLYQQGRLKGQVSDHQLKEVLAILTDNKEITIRRR